MSTHPLIGRIGFAVRYGLRMARGKRGVLRHLRNRDKTAVPMPTFVQLRVTNVCNLRCKMCGQWGDTGIFRADVGGKTEAEAAQARDLIGHKRQMTLAEYETLLDELAPHNPVITLYGGEPFLYPDILPLMRAVKRRGLFLTMITNGWHLEKHARDIVEIGIDTIAVSVDGPAEVHDRIRGTAASFERLSAGVRAVAHWRKELRKPLPVMMAILPVTELNADSIPAAAEELSKLPLDLVNVGLRWFIPEDVGNRYEAAMQEAFAVEGSSWRGFKFSWPGGQDAVNSKQMRGLVDVMKKLRRKRILDWMRGKPWVSFVPAVEADEVPAYFTDYDQTFGHDFCPVPWYFAQVEPDGEVCFCGDFPDYFIGNVRERRFEEVWRGPLAVAFRRYLAEKPLPVCARCCGNFVYGKWKRPTVQGLGSRPVVQ